MGVHAFSQPWAHCPVSGVRHLAYINPPFQTMGEVVRKIADDRVDCILVAPQWPRHWVVALGGCTRCQSSGWWYCLNGMTYAYLLGVCHTRSASSCSILDTRWLPGLSCGTTPRFREKIGLHNELKDSSPSVIGRQLVTIH